MYVRTHHDGQGQRGRKGEEKEGMKQNNVHDPGVMFLPPLLLVGTEQRRKLALHLFLTKF